MKTLPPIIRYCFPCCFAGLVFFAASAGGSEGGPRTFEEFEKSATAGATVPAGLSEPLKSLWYAKAGKWEEAHEIAQDISTPTGSWIHAFLHREEGDESNSAYWYRRAGKTKPVNVETAREWSEIARELWQSENGITPGREIFTSASGWVAASLETPAQEEGVWDTVIRKDGKVVLHIPNARPVSFSPGGDVLLLLDSAADDNCRHFLIKPAADLQVPPFGKRVPVGGRFVSQHRWSDDGKSLTLISDPAAGEVKPETIVVAENLTPR